MNLSRMQMHLFVFAFVMDFYISLDAVQETQKILESFILQIKLSQQLIKTHLRRMQLYPFTLVLVMDFTFASDTVSETIKNILIFNLIKNQESSSIKVKTYLDGCNCIRFCLCLDYIPSLRQTLYRETKINIEIFFRNQA